MPEELHVTLLERAGVPVKAASSDDFGREFLDYVLAVRDTQKFLAIAETGGSTPPPVTGEPAGGRIPLPAHRLQDPAIAAAPRLRVVGHRLAEFLAEHQHLGRRRRERRRRSGRGHATNHRRAE